MEKSSAIPRYARGAGLTLAALAGALLVLWATSSNGPAATLDTANYMAAARSLIRGDGYLMTHGGPMVLWPPLFPSLLGVGSLAGIEPLQAARILNAASFALIILVAAWWFSRHLRHRTLAVLATAMVVVGGPLAVTSCWALTEALYNALVVLCLVSLARFAEDRRPTSLFAAAAFASLACLQRYIGVVLLPVGALLILAPSATDRLGRRVKAALGYCLVAGVPVALWMARNYSLTKALTGVRLRPPHSPLENLEGIWQTLPSFFIPRTCLGVELPLVVRLVGLSVFCGIVAVGCRAVWRRRGPTQERALISAMGGYVLVFLPFFLMTVSLVHTVLPNQRLLSSLYFPLLVLVMSGLDRCLIRPCGGARTRRGAAGLGRAGGVVLCLLMVGHQGSESFKEAAKIHGQGASLTARRWHESPLIRRFQQSPPPPGELYSNIQEYLYLHCGLWSWRPPRRREGLDAGLREVRSESIFIWFDSKHRQWRDTVRRSLFDYDTEYLLHHPALEVLERHPDGWVLRAKRVSDPDSSQMP